MMQRAHDPRPARLRDSRPRRTLRLILGTLLAMVSVAAAQRVDIGPLSIVVNPVPAFDVDVFLDRGVVDGQAPLYRVGEPVRVGVEVSSSAWVYLFDVGADGRITQILPNRYDDAGRDNFLTAGETKYFPPRNARYEFLVDGPNGLSKVFAVASKDELDTRQLARFRSDEPFAQSDLDEDGFARALGIVVEPIEASGWVTDATSYWVGERRVPQPELRPTPPERGERLFDAPALYAPGGMRIVEMERERDETEAVLIGDLNELYGSLHRQLRDQGWSLRDRERSDDAIEAEYRRDGRTLELEIEREGRDRLELEIELEDDD